jgi:hypothetical protein
MPVIASHKLDFPCKRQQDLPLTPHKAHRRSFLKTVLMATGGMLAQSGLHARSLEVTRDDPFGSRRNLRPAGIALIFNDWSMQDWVKPEVRVTQRMIVDTVRTFSEWRSKFGLPFQYYNVDVFWFDTKSKFDRWDMVGFPHGPGAALSAIRRAGMQLGLWYSGGGRSALPEAWANSRVDEDYSMSVGSFRSDLRNAWEKAYSDWGLRLIKFDFASFGTVLPGDSQADQRRRLSLIAFRNLVRDFKRAHPDVLFLLYNGFAYNGRVIQSTLQDPLVEQSISTEWSTSTDWTYCGDTIPADYPALRLRRGTEIYNDHQVRRWHWAGIPLDQIDESGCFIGNGGSWFNLGPKDFRTSWLLMMVRGSRKAMLYGNPALMSRADVAWMASVYQRANALVKKGASVEIIGGWPAKGDPYGYRLSYDGSGWLVLINPKWERHRFSIQLGLGPKPRVSFLGSDSGVQPPTTMVAGQLQIDVGPGQLVWFGLGDEEDQPFSSAALTGGFWPDDLQQVRVDGGAKPEGAYGFRTEVAPGRRLIWLLQFEKSGVPYRVRMGEEVRIQDGLRIKASGGEVVEELHDKPIWAGVSYWVMQQQSRTGPLQILAYPEDRELVIHAKAFVAS